MGDWHDDARTTRLLRGTAALYGLVIVVHLADHLRRGVDASPDVIIALGSAATLLQFLAVAVAFTRRTFAPLLAVAVALPDAVGVLGVHLLPRWSATLSDPLVGSDPAPGVTAFSWITALAQLLAALAFAYAGWVAFRRVRAATP